VGLNQLTEGGGLNEALSRRYGIQGPPSQVMASEVFPIVPISDEMMDPELHFLAGSRLAGGFAALTADPVELPHVGLVNPASSGVIAACSLLIASASVLGRVVLTVARPLPAGLTLTTGAFRDSRNTLGGLPSCRLATLRSPGVTEGGVVYSFQLDATDREVRVPVVLQENSALLLSTVAATEALLQVSLVWRERRVGSWEGG
jgi:hypothetical protein